MAKKELHERPIFKKTNFFATLTLTILSIILAIFGIKTFLKSDDQKENKIEIKPDSVAPLVHDTVFIKPPGDKPLIQPIENHEKIIPAKESKIQPKEDIYRELSDLTLTGSIVLQNPPNSGTVTFHLTETSPDTWKATAFFGGGTVTGEMTSYGLGTINNNTDKQTIQFTGTITNGKVTVKCSTTLEINTKTDYVEGRYERDAIPNGRFKPIPSDWGTYTLNITQKN